MSVATMLDEVADAIATALDTITDLKVYDHEPRDLDVLPAATVLGPTNLHRTEPEEAESQLGASDWHLNYTARLYLPLDDPSFSQSQCRAYLGQAVAAVEADRTLGLGYVLDARLVDAEYGVTDTDEVNERQMAIYECQVQVWALV